MNLKKISILLIMCFLIGGCRAENYELMEKAKYEIPVQEYTGVEYPANEKEERWEYIKQHKKDIEANAITWVKDTFDLDVKINHMYPKNGAAVATAEWVHDPNLKIKVVLDLDEKNERVSGVNPSMDAENNIMSYIAYKVYQEEFNKLDIFLEEFCKKENLYGLTDEYVHNMGGFASMDRNYYYISAGYLDYPNTYMTFLNNPSIDLYELKQMFEEEYRNNKQESIEKGYLYGVNFQISLYSSSDKIDESIFKRLEKSFIKKTYLPNFNYAFTLNKNTINTKTNATTNSAHYPDMPTNTGYIKVIKGEE